MSRFSSKKIAGGLLIMLIACLWVFQLDSLYNPYFWDEMGVYGYGVNYLVEHGISLFPKDLPPDISRGHPLLFFSLYAFAIKLLGNGLFVSHGLALLISSLTLVATYRLARVFVRPLVAVLAPILLVVQNIFLAQSTLVLPEMLVALLSTLAFLSYFKKKYFWTIIFLCIGVWVKESVIISAGFFGIVHMVECILEKKFKKSFWTILGFSSPLLVLFLFLFLQKLQNGWYFFPYHTDLISEGVLSGFIKKFAKHLLFIFFKQGRFLWLPLLGLGVVTLLLSKHRKQATIMITFIIYTIIIFALAFYMDRYLLYLYPLITVGIVSGIDKLFHKRIVVNVLVFVLCLSSILSMRFYSEAFNYDVALSYRSLLSIHQESVNELCEKADELEENQSLIVYTNFPINMSLWESYLGYANDACLNTIVRTNTIEKANYLILNRASLSEYEKLIIVDRFPSKSYSNASSTIDVYTY